MDQNNAANKLPAQPALCPICITVRSYLHYSPSPSNCLSILIDKNQL